MFESSVILKGNQTENYYLKGETEFESINIDEKVWNKSYSDKLTLKAEEPVEAQQLYATLSPMIQEILTDKNADIPAIVKKANENFQKDFLDKIR